VIDRSGPGARVPAIVISPFAKGGFVDHTAYDTTSILRLIETRWGLPPLTDRDARANNLFNAFAFESP
jgi:phospholipase C